MHDRSLFVESRRGSLLKGNCAIVALPSRWLLTCDSQSGGCGQASVRFAHLSPQHPRSFCVDAHLDIHSR
eukprot:scaffold86717_cov28-Tisochrysis_lutea.AAC.1